MNGKGKEKKKKIEKIENRVLFELLIYTEQSYEETSTEPINKWPRKKIVLGLECCTRSEISYGCSTETVSKQ